MIRKYNLSIWKTRSNSNTLQTRLTVLRPKKRSNKRQNRIPENVLIIFFVCEKSVLGRSRNRETRTKTVKPCMKYTLFTVLDGSRPSFQPRTRFSKNGSPQQIYGSRTALPSQTNKPCYNRLRPHQFRQPY